MAGDQAPGGAKKTFDFGTMIQSLWQGKIPLRQVFWIYYVAVIVAIKVVGSILPALGAVLVLIQLVWAGFMVWPIMVAADRYKGPRHWSVLAKIFAVLLGLAVVADLFR